MTDPIYCVTLLQPAKVDATLLSAYLAGRTEREAAAFVAATEWQAEEVAEVIPFLLRDATDAYRFFAALEPALAAPGAYALGSFPYITLPVSDFDALVQRYYTPCFPVLRSLLGKQLSSKLRKDLDVVAESTEVRVRECQRNYDNLRRLFDALDDLDFAVPVFPFIRSHFRLGQRLAWLYTCLLFVMKLRMQVADSRKRLAAVSCDVLVDCASAIILHWTNGAGTSFPLDAAGRALRLQHHALVHPPRSSAPPTSDDSTALSVAVPPPIALPPAVPAGVPPARVLGTLAPAPAPLRAASGLSQSTVLAAASVRNLQLVADASAPTVARALAISSSTHTASGAAVTPAAGAPAIGASTAGSDHVAVDIAALSVRSAPQQPRLPVLQLAAQGESHGAGSGNAYASGAGSQPSHHALAQPQLHSHSTLPLPTRGGGTQALMAGPLSSSTSTPAGLSGATFSNWQARPQVQPFATASLGSTSLSPIVSSLTMHHSVSGASSGFPSTRSTTMVPATSASTSGTAGPALLPASASGAGGHAAGPGGCGQLSTTSASGTGTPYWLAPAMPLPAAVQADHTGAGGGTPPLATGTPGASGAAIDHVTGTQAATTHRDSDAPHWQAASASVATSAGFTLDPAFIMVLKDLAGHLLKTRPERHAYGVAVLTAFTLHSAAGDPAVHATGMGSAASASQHRSAPITATLAATARNEAVHRQLDTRLPSLLKHLRDLALSLAQPNPLKDLLEDIAGNIVDQCVQAGLQCDDLRRLLACTVEASSTLPYVAALPHAARVAYVSQWMRFIAVVDYCAFRLWPVSAI